MDFQAEVGTWLAAHLLARMPVGGRFGLANTALPVSIQLETGDGLDDIRLEQDDASRIDLQSKTSAGLAKSPKSPLGKTISQLALLMIDARDAGVAIDPAKARAVLAVAADAPRTLDVLERGCRAFDLGGSWATTKAGRSLAERDALDLFERHARIAWASMSATPPTDDDLVMMARLFRIARFSMNECEENWREVSRLIGGRLYGSQASGDAPLRDLKGIIRSMIGNGAPADRAGLLRELRRLGHKDVGAADYTADLGRLSAATGAELARLAGHTRLPIAGGIPIARASDGPLRAAVDSGSLIVIGEPGAGKTGALVMLAETRRAAGDTVVFLSVDRFPGVGIAANLQSELGLEHPLVEVLSAAPGSGAKLLIIDALDAARGGPAEGVFAQLIETLGASATDWTIIASIRSFDLRNGRRFRDAMPGSPPDPAFAEPGLANVRHFQVPRLAKEDLDAAGAAAADLGTLLAAAPEKLHDLLRNVFNLSLAAQLLADGAKPDSIRTVATQSDLIDAYEDGRLMGTALHEAAAATVGAMVSRRRLAVRKVVVGHGQLDMVIQTGVLIGSGDLVSFAHHVLFDHVAGRFFLEWDDPTRLIGQLGGDSSIALMLAPALRFAIERLWRHDADGKALVWRLVAEIYADAAVDPVLANVALRTAIERVAAPSDVAGLVALILTRPNDEALATMLSRLARFVGLAVDTSGTIVASEAIAWAQVADAAIATGSRDLSDATRFLLHTMFDKGDIAEAELLDVFGRAARALLAFAWAADPPMQQTATNSIRFVSKSFASDPAASRTLLDRMLRDPHFSAHADREATWLSEQIMPIARVDPDFTIEIYRVLYSRDITDSSTSHFGGQASRIMPLSSSRSQDYRHCRYNLGRCVTRLLELSVPLGTRAIVEAALGETERAMPLGDDRKRVAIVERAPFDLLGRDYTFKAWDDSEARHGTQDDDVLAQLVTHLRACSPEAFAATVVAAASEYAGPAVWTRILGVGAERVGEVGDLLWPFASNVTILVHADIVRDAVRFLATVYPSRSIEEREAFEVEALRPDLFTDEADQSWWRRTLSRLLSLIDADAIASDPMRALRDELVAADELLGNPPTRLMTVCRGSDRGVTRDQLSSEAVDVDDGIDAQMLSRTEALYEKVQATPLANDAATLADLWAEVQATIAFWDANADALNAKVEQPVWGHISNAVERIAGAKAYESGVDAMPPIEELLTVLRRLWASRFPEAEENDGGDSSLSWGNWEVRVYAAGAYVSLADRFGETYGEIVEIFDAILADPVPQVRLQAAQSLQVLSRIAIDNMWELAEQVARDEPHTGVLSSFLHHVIPRFTWHDVEKCKEIIEIVRARREAVERDDKPGRDEVAEQLGGLTAQLWCWQEEPVALEWLTSWADDPAAHCEYFTAFLSMLRGAFFTRYASGEERDARLSDRSQRAAMIIVEACSTAAVASHAAVTKDEVDGDARDAAIATYKAAESIIGHLMNQLYFGSGAHADNREAATGLTSTETMRRFLDDYRPMLALLAASHEPSTHHHLVELYEFLIPGDPAGVFDALHALLTGPAAREGYHHENLAAPVIVRMITRYIADHRSIFEDDTRRSALVEILRLFSDVGWLDALKLLYELPDLLR
ncbi:ATP-binding protein [Vannielia litorea]|uniref:ATP-binding protein n=1 Tax=Vannielia litorea TaxID=1217970 RepID=UPI001C959CFA|nr:ATP-binding protein [Vannielia litorea]MBY6046704.1 ATP-binding protein [Vannielia litorea]MBY6074118.1 ATP-binding protein [Vannielia litorea]